MDKPPPNQAWKRWQAMLRLPDQEARRQIACWDWFALLRLVQCAYPDAPRLGYGVSVKDEPLRLGQPPFFHPPSTTVADFARHGPSEHPDEQPVSSPPLPPEAKSNASGPVAWIYSHHLGLFGPHGPLPLHLTEFAHQQLRQRDAAFFAFCNVLTHRFLCLFFRAWAEGRKEMTLDRPHSLSPSLLAYARQDIAGHGEESWEFFMGSLLGCGLDSLRGRDRVPEEARLFYAGHLMQQTRNAEGLRGILEHFFDMPVHVLEFQPRTLPIPESAQWKLGLEGPVGRLGWSTLVGSSVVDYQSGFRIRMGPLSLAEIEVFFPQVDGSESESFGELHDWIRFYRGKDTDPNLPAGVESAWDLQLVLRGSEVPPLKLGESARLGLTTWLYSSPPQNNVDDLVLCPRVGRQPRQEAVAESVMLAT